MLLLLTQLRKHEIAIQKLKIGKYIDFYICNEDISNAKPHPEIYLRILLKLNLKPKEAVVVEDSHYGRVAGSRLGLYIISDK